MPGKARVHELAKEFGVDSKTVLATLKEQGEFVKSASSTVEAPVARRLREALGAATGGAAPSAPAGGRYDSATWIRVPPLGRLSNCTLPVASYTLVNTAPSASYSIVVLSVPSPLSTTVILTASSCVSYV